MTYSWQLNDWPDFAYDSAAIIDALLVFSEKAGRVSGLVRGLSKDTRDATIIDILVSEAIKTSEIEGEFLSRKDVMSSIRNNLGITGSSKKVGDRRARGVADMVIAARRDYQSPLSETMLFDWHDKLLHGTRGLKTGAWRTHSEPMQIVSGAIGKQIVHYEAPPSDEIPIMMQAFIYWFNNSSPRGEAPIAYAPVRSAIAHLYFETIHPFEDGNGRIGRTLSEKALSQGLERPILLSLSKAIESNKNAYYEALKRAQRTNEITDWILYFLDLCLHAQTDAEEQIEFTLLKVNFFDRFKDRLNERQEKVIRRMLEEGRAGFRGGMSAKKYVTIAHTSKPTATRDLRNLVEIDAFTVTGSGRSTRYWLNMRPDE